MRALVFFVLLVAWVGCGPRELPCQTSQNCPADSACVDSVCAKRACFASSECAVGSHCDLNVGQCKAGCELDGDCYYGQVCDRGSCVQKPCTSTQLDCSAGEYCDINTGTCFAAPGPWCRDCTRATQEQDCGVGNICVYVSGEGPWCSVACDESRPCPAGFTCLPFEDSGDDIYTYYCVALCQYFPEAGRMTPAEHP